MNNLRYRTKTVRNIPITIEELVPFLLKTHADLLQEGASKICYDLGTRERNYDTQYGVIEISYHSPETPEEKESEERYKRIRERAEREQYEKLRSKFEGN